MKEQNLTNTLQGLNQVEEKVTKAFFSLPEKGRKRLTHLVSWGGALTGMLASSTPVFADLKETTKSAGVDIWNYILIGGIVLGVIIMGLGLVMWGTGSRRLTEEGQKRIFYSGIAVAALFLVGLIVKFLIGTVTNGGGSANPFTQLPF